MATLLFKGKFEDLLNRSKEFSGLDIEVFDPEDDIDYSENMPDPPFTVRDKAHLEELLLEAVNSPKEPMTDQDWVDMRVELYRRHIERNGRE